MRLGLAVAGAIGLFDISIPAPRRFWFVYPPRLAGTPKLALFREWLFAELDGDRMLAARGKRAKQALRAARKKTAA